MYAKQHRTLDYDEHSCREEEYAVRITEKLEHVCQTHRQNQAWEYPGQADQVYVPACIEWHACHDNADAMCHLFGGVRTHD